MEVTSFKPRKPKPKHISANLQSMLDEGSVKKKLSKHYDDDYLNKVVSASGYTYLELQTAFELIQNTDGWKEPISAEILDEDFDVCAEACVFITGSQLVKTDEVATDGKIKVEADGYYAAIGS